MSRIYWLGVSIASMSAFNMERGGVVLAALLESAGKVIPSRGFRYAKQQDDEFMPVSSVKSIIYWIRSSLADVGLDNIIETAPGGYVIDKHNAERVLAFIEEYVGK